jgi:formate hydrogenlyase subunit 3/multisubunit Na+/H+ antiporter MnhD subunit
VSDTALQIWPVLLLPVPLLAAFATLVWHERAHAIGLAASAVFVLGALSLIASLVLVGPSQHPLGGWVPPLGITLRSDGFAAAMVVLTIVVAGVLGTCARGYFGEHALPVFWPLWLFLQVALVALFLSGDAFNLYVTLEVMSVSAVALVTLAGTHHALAAAFRYLLISLVGSLAYLLGVGLLYNEAGALDLALLQQRLTPTAASALAASLMTGGLLLKGAIFPMHFWLPAAHGGAPALVSAALSGLVVKGSLYILVRLWTEVFPVATWVMAVDIVALLGGAAVLWGGLHAFRASRLKLVIAYSTVAQLGYVGLALPLAARDGAGGTGWLGLTLFLVAHGLAKAGLFASAGALQKHAGHDEVRSLAAAGAGLPLAMLGIGIAAITLIGLPPSAGFAAKWLLLESALAHGRWTTVIVLGAGSLLSAAYLFRVIQPAFVTAAAGDGAPTSAHAVALARGGLVLAVASVMLGLLTAPILELLSDGQATALAEPR